MSNVSVDVSYFTIPIHNGEYIMHIIIKNISETSNRNKYIVIHNDEKICVMSSRFHINSQFENDGVASAHNFNGNVYSYTFYNCIDAVCVPFLLQIHLVIPPFQGNTLLVDFLGNIFALGRGMRQQ